MLDGEPVVTLEPVITWPPQEVWLPWIAAGLSSISNQSAPVTIDAPHELLSPMHAAGRSSTKTVLAPLTTLCGPPLQPQTTLSPSFASPW